MTKNGGLILFIIAREDVETAMFFEDVLEVLDGLMSGGHRVLRLLERYL